LKVFEKDVQNFNEVYNSLNVVEIDGLGKCHP